MRSGNSKKLYWRQMAFGSSRRWDVVVRYYQNDHLTREDTKMTQVAFVECPQAREVTKVHMLPRNWYVVIN
jgi:hypothetical protein